MWSINNESTSKTLTNLFIGFIEFLFLYYEISNKKSCSYELPITVFLNINQAFTKQIKIKCRTHLTKVFTHWKAREVLSWRAYEGPNKAGSLSDHRGTSPLTTCFDTWAVHFPRAFPNNQLRNRLRTRRISVVYRDATARTCYSWSDESVVHCNPNEVVKS